MFRKLLPVALISYSRRHASQRQLVMVTAHHRYRTKLEPLGAVHRADNDALRPGYLLRLKTLTRDARCAEGWADAFGDKLARASKNGNFVQCHSFIPSRS